MYITRTAVIKMLENYRNLARCKSQLTFEIQNYQSVVTDEDIIDSIMFGQSTDGIVAKGWTSDKTAKTALSYEDYREAITVKDKKDLESDLMATQLAMERIEHYVSLLDVRQAEAIRLTYIEGLTIVQAAEQMVVTVVTVSRNRNVGVTSLTEMLNRIIKK